MNLSVENKKDKYLAIIISVFFLIAMLLAVDTSCWWGDDYAAYISEGIAIFEKNFENQIELNYFMHPSPLPLEATNQRLVYAWGYPLVLGIVYKLFGFDNITYSSLIYYKIPTVIAFSIMSGCLYMLYRKRFSRNVSLISTIYFCAFSAFYSVVNIIYSDLYFLSFSVICFYFSEQWIYKGKKLISAFFLGVLLWYILEVRLTGIMVLLSIFLNCLIFELSNKEQRAGYGFKDIKPYILLIVSVLTLKIVTENFLLARATSNSSDLINMFSKQVIDNILFNVKLILEWMDDVNSVCFINPLYSIFRRVISPSSFNFVAVRLFFRYICVAVLVLGILNIIKDKKNYYLLFYLLVSFIGTSTYQYCQSQGYRYLFPILPWITLTLGGGIAFIEGKFVTRKVKAFHLIGPVLSGVLAASIIFGVISSSEEDTDVISNAYSSKAIEIYEYINLNISEDSIIAFHKPRSLFLNTHRVSFRPTVNNHSLKEADYYLRAVYGDSDNISEESISGEIIYSNEWFKLYKMIKK